LAWKLLYRKKVCALAMGIMTLLCLAAEAGGKEDHSHGRFVHVVATGETLDRIARQYLPLTESLTTSDLTEQIKKLNHLKGSLIHPKQQLIVPLVRSTPLKAKTIAKQRDFLAKGIYVNRYSMACQKITRLADTLLANGGNTVILDGKDMSGKLSYTSKVPLARSIGASNCAAVSDPAKLFHYLHQKGLHIGVRLVLFYDPLLARKRPEFALRSSVNGAPVMDNGKIAWVDPARVEVQDYCIEIAKEVAAMGVDEIQFDYIRFPTVALGEGDARDDEPGKISRDEIITRFLARAYRELQPYKVLLSIDVFGITAWDRVEDVAMTGQNIAALAAHCDVISPMIYPSHFYNRFHGLANPGDAPFLLVSKTCARFAALLKGSRVTVRPWIQAFPFGTKKFNGEYVVQQLLALKESKSRGWLLWSAGNAYDVAWEGLAQWHEMESNAGRQFTYMFSR